jgi:hypothetical protein
MQKALLLPAIFHFHFHSQLFLSCLNKRVRARQKVGDFFNFFKGTLSDFFQEFFFEKFLG